MIEIDRVVSAKSVRKAVGRRGLERMVSFIGQKDAGDEFRKRGFDDVGLIQGSRADARMKCSAFTYRSRVHSADSIADSLAAELGAFSACLVWACRRALGDHAGEGDFNPDWDDYQNWRNRHGATSILARQPGHRFQRGEACELKRLIASALYLVWDTLLMSDASKTIIKLSHDDRIELYYFSSPTCLESKLARLCEPARWFDPRR